MADDSSGPDSRPSAAQSKKSQPDDERGRVYDWRPVASTLPRPWPDEEIEAIRAAVGRPLSDDGRRKLAEGLRLPVSLLLGGLVSDGKPSASELRNQLKGIEQQSAKLLDLLTGESKPFGELLPALALMRLHTFGGNQFNIDAFICHLSEFNFFASREAQRQSIEIKNKIRGARYKGKPIDQIVLNRLADVFEKSFKAGKATATCKGPFLRFVSAVFEKAGYRPRTEEALTMAVRRVLGRRK